MSTILSVWPYLCSSEAEALSPQILMTFIPDLQQEANLQRVKKGDMKASIHRMEIDRIRFVLSSYLRSRLQKVGAFTPRLRQTPQTNPVVERARAHFDVGLSRLKSFSRTCWRKRSPDRWESRRCCPQRSSPLPKSEYSKVKLERSVRK